MPRRRIRQATTPKQRFEEYEKTLRFVVGGARDQRRTLDRNFQAAWRARSQAQRDSIADLCADALDAEDDFQRLSAESADAAALIGRVGGQPTIGDQLQNQTWQEVVSRAVQLLNEFRARQVEARNAWTALEQGHRRQQPHSDDRSINDANAKATLAGNGIAATNASIAYYALRIVQPDMPADPATGIQKLLPNWTSEQRYAAWRGATARTRQNINAVAVRPPVAGNWVFKKVVGSGGQGSAQLWLYYDVNNVLRERVVRKVVDFSNEWFDLRRFRGDNPQMLDDRIPWELECHWQMTRAAGVLQDANGDPVPNEHITALGAPSDQRMVDNMKRIYRIYTEWCPGGDLDAVIDYYARQNPDQPVPEPFIWAVAEALISAGVAMLTGSESGTILDEWDPIVHRDLKPGNIFLAGRSSQPNIWQDYACPRVGDWGYAIAPTPFGASNPTFWQGEGTLGFFAPEQLEFVDNRNMTPVMPWQLGEKTNVFGVGVVLFCLVTQQISPPQAWWLGVSSNDTTYQLDPPPSAPAPDDPKRFASQYSQELRQFIDNCTRYDYATRANFNMLQQLFDQAITKNGGQEDPAITKGMRSGTAAFGVAQVESLPGRFMNDAYS